MRSLTYSLLIVVLIATVGLGWLFDQAYEQYSANEPSRDVDKVKLLEQLGTALASTLNDLPARTQFVEQWGRQEAPKEYELSLASIENFPIPDALLAQIKNGKVLLLESNKHLTFHYYLPGSEEVLILKAPLINFGADEKPLNYVFTVLFYITLLTLFLLWVYPLVRQLIKLRKTAKLFGEGKLSERISHGTFPYIRDIEVEFNHMAQRIEDLLGDVKLLSSAVSHDLRTPLARIRFGIDTLEEEEDPQIRARYQQKISANVDEMTTLVETLLSYARLDQAMLEIKRDPINISELLRTCINQQSNEAVDISFVAPDDDINVIADKSYLTIVINNLLQNSIRYGSGVVAVNLAKEDDKVVFSVEDNGKGIAEGIRKDVLKPFVRGDATKHSIKGHGIGLAIVKRILDWHKGYIEISDSVTLGGAKLTVSLPIP
jgi:two-component system OmpR family sensor kinase